METLIIETDGENLVKIKTFLKEIRVNFKIKKQKDKPYNPVFVSKILATKNESAIRVNPHNIWESIL